MKIGSINHNIYRTPPKTPPQTSFKGWAPEKPQSAKVVDDMIAIIKSPDVQKIAISGHESPDGDCIGAGFAFANLINKITDKKVDFFVFENISKCYEFLNTNPSVNLIKLPKNAEPLDKKYGKYDLAVSIDTAHTSMMLNNYYRDIFSKAKQTFKIDHHSVNNDYARYNFVNDSSQSASQLIMQFVKPAGINFQNLDSHFLKSVYTGILCDSGAFKRVTCDGVYSDTVLLADSGLSLKQTEEEIHAAEPEILKKVRPIVHETVVFSDNGKIAYFVEDENLAKLKEEAKDLGCHQDVKNEVKAALNELLDIDGVEAAFKVGKYDKGVSFSLRSKNYDTLPIAKLYGGGGHPYASACKIEGENLDDKRLAASILEKLEELIANQR